MSISYLEITKNEEIKTYIRKADESLSALGFTEHSFAHVGKVSSDAEYILKTLRYPEHDIELVKIAAYLHDIGNIVNRIEHSQSGAIMAFRILDRLNMPAKDIATIITAIGNHDEGTGVPVDHVSAALILADKSDVRRSRVRNNDISTFDIHDRVNYSVQSSKLEIDSKKKIITLSLIIDTKMSSVMDYFEIFLARMMLCRKAAEKLGLKFSLVINDQPLL
ncbi:MAG: HD domain-containing protein [Ruminococcaceae bacterium]|nr:HD domain-containing protein [Oscillospiraceae bacterium]